MRIIVLLSALLICGSLTAAEAAPVFSIAGSWSGSGTFAYRGQVDRVYCRSRFTKTSAKSFAVSSLCTTANGRYEINGNVTSTGGGRYRGTVISGNVSGRVTVFYAGRQMSVNVTSKRGSAQITLARR
jgi:short subunit dehydrogenase-like uncharacterized protein